MKSECYVKRLYSQQVPWVWTRATLCGEEIKVDGSKAIECHYKSLIEEFYWAVCCSAYADVLVNLRSLPCDWREK